MTKPLEDKTAVITGANQGLGLEIARKYLEAGASVSICARDAERLAQAKRYLQGFAGSRQEIVSVAADISRNDDSMAVVEKTNSTFGRIDILVNNAGVYGPKGTVEEVGWEDWARAMEINLYGSVLMCRAVLPHMKRQRKGKIVQLSGGGATKPLPRLSAYAVSKAAVVRFAETLAEEVKEYNIDVNAIAPGALNTRMLKEVLDAGPGNVGQAFYDQAVKQAQSGGTSLEKGADLAVFLGSSLSDGITGKLISAVWDPWASLVEHKEDLRKTDIYTLRRILPDDRGKNWGSE
ncbi:MAG: SDR family oxidoreductase [Betaproteobacteria bacterium]|nr:MAG: SDR family oxidoreductase [Betaproteobacteria bacterium]